jgi:predicted choloylglycine hydrolase
MLRQHMPQLVPTWEALVDLAGGDDTVARFLAMWCPPPYIRGCSQVVWPSDPPCLARNYDYAPRLWDAVLWRTKWTGPIVMAMTDSLWGVLDGMNEAGVCVSLAFGGRAVVGPGFGMPLILRYVLETCETTTAAVDVLTRVPTHMAYNVTVLDASGAFATVATAPDRPAEVSDTRACTNHQRVVDWPRYVEATQSEARLQALTDALADPTVDVEDLLLRAPLHRDDFGRAMGTLYTAVWRPAARSLSLRWPDSGISQTLDAFTQGRHTTPVPAPGEDPP